MSSFIAYLSNTNENNRIHNLINIERSEMAAHIISLFLMILMAASWLARAMSFTRTTLLNTPWPVNPTTVYRLSRTSLILTPANTTNICQSTTHYLSGQQNPSQRQHNHQLIFESSPLLHILQLLVHEMLTQRFYKTAPFCRCL